MDVGSSGELYVGTASEHPGLFATANANVAPVRTISGGAKPSRSTLRNLYVLIAVLSRLPVYT